MTTTMMPMTAAPTADTVVLVRAPASFLTALTRDRRMSTPKDRDRVMTERRQPYSFRDVEDSIDTFGAEDGQDVKLWMSQFEAMSRTALWNDEQKLIMCRKKMTGTARRFMFAQRDLTSFAKLKSALIKEFAPFIRASDVHRQLAARKRKPNEAIRDYIYEMQRIALSIDLDEPSICEYVVDGITDDEFHRSLLYEAQTIRQLKEKLLNFEKVQKKGGAKPKPHEGQKKKDQREKECKKSSEKLGSKKYCFNSGDSAHVAGDCPQKSDGPKCFNCNSFGHLSRDCPKSGEKAKQHDGGKKSASKVNTMKSAASANPSVLIKIGEHDVSATVDTGSEISLVRNDFWLELVKNGAQMKKSDMKVRGYGGDVKAVCGESVLNISIENEVYEILVYVVPQQAIDMKMLIGMDFLRVVDYSITTDGVQIKKIPVIEPECEAKWIRRIEEYVGKNEIVVPYQYREEVMDLIESYEPASSVTASNTLKIKLCDNEVVCMNPRRLAPLERDVVKKQIDEWLVNGIIQPSESEYASAVVVVPKKDGSRRVCVDYREINKKMIRDKFPMPNVEEQIDKLSGARVFTTLDLENSYFHVPVDEESRKYTSGNAFGRFINTALKDLISDGTIIAFIDDIIIPTENEEEGMQKLRKVLSVAEKAGFRFNWAKCVFLQRRVEYIGYVVHDGQVEPAPAKIEKVKQFPMPTTVKQLQRF
nr:uncharacterized protein K02A2.6-like [Aedes albopictus]